MSAPIGPGDWVECVSAHEMIPQIKRGGLYCVEAAREMEVDCAGCRDCPRISLRLAGVAIEIAGYRPDFMCASVFRPIYRPKQSIIEALKAPVARTPKVAQPIREDQ